MPNYKNLEDLKLAVIGLGYVGLPLAVAFGSKREVIGFDIDKARVSELIKGLDNTNEVEAKDIFLSTGLSITDDRVQLRDRNCFIVTVPTPIESMNQPDLGPLKSATLMIAEFLKPGDIVIYESTVYPGCTEEVCVPILERHSGLKYNRDFFCGYSPERINPGDMSHRIENIIKVTSGSTPRIADLIDGLYNEIVNVGTHRASSIKVAEAAKVIENTQRDLNIALVNELAIIFNKLGVDTQEVLAAAGTKWNFLNFKPGLVGGHCIGVDPYYLTFKAQSLGYSPEIILAGRRLNDTIPQYVGEQLIRFMIRKDIRVLDSSVLILGLAFKENCPDIRNTKVKDIYNCLIDYGVKVDVFDPLVKKSDASDEYGIEVIDHPQKHSYEAIILAVAHEVFIELGVENIKDFGKDDVIFYDLKSAFSADVSDIRL